MKIHDIKIINNTIFAVDMHKLVGWDLKERGAGLVGLIFWPGAHLTRRVVFDEKLAICTNVEQLRLSHIAPRLPLPERGRYSYMM